METDHPTPPRRLEVEVPVGDVAVAGILTLPPEALGMVVFAHGSGSGRLSPRNNAVADVLHRAGFGTLLIDLLTAEEEKADLITRRLRFDIPLLAERVIAATEWLDAEATVGGLQDLPLGCFGASTGAAAALVAAAERPHRVGAVVSRSGHPTLAGEALSRVSAPTLLIVGSRDPEVLGLNRQAQAALGGLSRVEIVPGAGHMFEEPGTLERAAVLTRDWFRRGLGPAS
jgi:putative phosphoribosyl transferase